MIIISICLYQPRPIYALMYLERGCQWSLGSPTVVHHLCTLGPSHPRCRCHGKKILFMDLNGGWCHNTSWFFRCTLIISDKPSLHGWVAHLNCSRFTASGLWAPHSLLSFGARSNWPRTQRSNKHQRSFPRFCWTKNNTSIRVPQKKKECLALLNSAWLLSVNQYLSLFLYIRREKSLSSSMLRE